VSKKTEKREGERQREKGRRKGQKVERRSRSQKEKEVISKNSVQNRHGKKQVILREKVCFSKLYFLPFEQMKVCQSNY
jgi:hypothetical protein